MEKSYSNSVWHLTGVGRLGVLALSAAFCLAGLLALSSCDDNDEAVPVPTQMRGFYISISGDDHGNAMDCTDEAVDLYLEEPLVVGETNVTIQSTGTVFGDAEFAGIGVKIPDNILTAHVKANKDGSFDRPYALFLVPVTDNAFSLEEGETAYAGYWTGYPTRPSKETVVICPYVLVPASALPSGSCGTDDNPDDRLGVTDPADDMNMALVKYLRDEDGLRNCYNLLDDEGLLSPMERQLEHHETTE